MVEQLTSDERLNDALSELKEAFHSLDEADVAHDDGVYVDLAIHRLEASLGFQGGTCSASRVKTGSSVQ